MVNHNLKTDARKLTLLIDGKLTFIVLDLRVNQVKLGEVLAFTDSEDKNTYPKEYRCLVVHVETENQLRGFAALGLLDLSDATEAELMGIGFLTTEQRAKLRRDPWDGIGLIDRSQKGLQNAVHWKQTVKECQGAKATVRQKQNEGWAYQELVDQFMNENAAKEFLARR